jgi:hypothetical protein
MFKTRALTGSLLVLGLLAAPSAALAEADDLTLTPSESIEAAGAVDPTSVEAASLVQSEGSLVSSSGPTVVEIGGDASEGVVLTTPNGDQVEIGLPGDPDKRGRLVGDSVVFEETAPATNVVVQAVEGGGTRQLITIADDSAPRRHEFSISIPDGGRSLVSDDGSVLVVDQNEQLVTSVDAPWARDAAGVAVPTRFEVNGSTVTQVIDFSADSAFPVTADPCWSCWWEKGRRIVQSRGGQSVICVGKIAIALVGAYRGQTPNLTQQKACSNALGR